MYNSYPDVVTVKQLCEMLHIGRNTAYMLLRDQKIHAIKIGRVYKIPKSAVIAFVKTNIESSSVWCYTKYTKR